MPRAPRIQNSARYRWDLAFDPGPRRSGLAIVRFDTHANPNAASSYTPMHMSTWNLDVDIHGRGGNGRSKLKPTTHHMRMLLAILRTLPAIRRFISAANADPPVDPKDPRFVVRFENQMGSTPSHFNNAAFNNNMRRTGVLCGVFYGFFSQHNVLIRSSGKAARWGMPSFSRIRATRKKEVSRFVKLLVAQSAQIALSDITHVPDNDFDHPGDCVLMCMYGRRIDQKKRNDKFSNTIPPAILNLLRLSTTRFRKILTSRSQVNNALKLLSAV